MGELDKATWALTVITGTVSSPPHMVILVHIHPPIAQTLHPQEVGLEWPIGIMENHTSSMMMIL